MKILHTADWHLGKKLYQFSRIEEQTAVLEEIADIADAHEVDIILIAGDIFDNFNPSAEVTELFYNTVKKMSRNGARPIIAIAGNHDSPDRIAAPDPLARACGIFLIGYPNSTIKPIEVHPDWAISRTDEGFIEIQFNNKAPLRIITTPYTNELRIKQYLGKEEDAGIRAYLSEQWNRLADTYMDNQGINILMAHLLVWNEGTKPPEEPEGEKPILIGNASIVYATLIPSTVQYVALGHLHRPQSIAGNAMPIHYVGSPLAYSFAESNQTKQVQIIELEPGSEAIINAVPLHSGTPLLSSTHTSIQDAIEWVQANPDKHLELKLKLDKYIDAESIKTLQSSAKKLLNIIPLIQTPHKTNKVDKFESNDIQSLFVQYFEDKKGLGPSEDLLQIFNELLQYATPSSDN